MQVFRVLVVITAFSLVAVSSVAAQGRSGAHRPTLPTQAQAGKGAAWKNGKASFETRRAIEAGRRVAREIMDRGRSR